MNPNQPGPGGAQTPLKAGDVSEKLSRLNEGNPAEDKPRSIDFVSYEKKGTARGKAVGGIKHPDDVSSVLPAMFALAPGISAVTCPKNRTSRSSRRPAFGTP